MADIVYGSSGDCRLDLGSPSEVEVSAQLMFMMRTRATRLVNSYIEKLYPDKIPFTASGDVPKLLDEITNELAVFYIKRGLHPGPDPLSEDVKEEYWNKPIDLLEKISNEEIKLPELTSAEPDRVEANRDDYVPVFDVDKIEESVIDEDLLDDIADERED